MIGTTTILMTFYVLIIGRSETAVYGSENVSKDAKVENFHVYWNVPTFMCHKYGMKFEEVSEKFGILQNQGDKFCGDEIAMLYDPGMFPALLEGSNGSLMIRNGGVPQAGNLTKHLEIFAEHLAEQIPDVDFQGLGVIDFESWRPIFRQNWASLYRYQIVGKLFMEETLKTAISLRPRASWGYYAYPYCFNFSKNQPNWRCSVAVSKENDRLSRIFEMENVLFPSVYLSTDLNETEKGGMIRGRVEEAMRIAKKTNPRTKVMPYFTYIYQDTIDTFLTRSDEINGLGSIPILGADGIVIWGSSKDLNTEKKCMKFRRYLLNTLGPAIVHARKIAKLPFSVHQRTADSAGQNGDGKMKKHPHSGAEDAKPSVTMVL